MIKCYFHISIMAIDLHEAYLEIEQDNGFTWLLTCVIACCRKILNLGIEFVISLGSHVMRFSIRPTLRSRKVVNHKTAASTDSTNPIPTPERWVGGFVHQFMLRERPNKKTRQKARASLEPKKKLWPSHGFPSASFTGSTMPLTHQVSRRVAT